MLSSTTGIVDPEPLLGILAMANCCISFVLISARTSILRIEERDLFTNLDMLAALANSNEMMCEAYMITSQSC